MNTNPFTLSFGKEPLSKIDRFLEENRIIDSFNDENPPFQVSMITGLRGSGKTVFLTSVSNSLRQNDNWIVIDLNPEKDMLSSFVGKLGSQKMKLLQINMLKNLLVNSKFSCVKIIIYSY